MLACVHRYVDDFFAAVPKKCMKEAMEDFAELVRLVLGDSSVSPTKLECGVPLCILGLDVSIDREGMQCKPRYGHHSD